MAQTITEKPQLIIHYLTDAQYASIAEADLDKTALYITPSSTAIDTYTKTEINALIASAISVDKRTEV